MTRGLHFLDSYNDCLTSPDVLKTVPVYEEVEGLQVVPQGSEEFSGNFPVNSGSLVAVAGKNGVVRVFAVEGNQVPLRKCQLLYIQ